MNLRASVQLYRLCKPDVDINGFIASAYVTRLDVKIKGDQVKPRFNVYADSNYIKCPRMWAQIREFLAGRNYKSTRIGYGRTVIAPNNCGICHSADHPRGLCPFPDVPGWNGPTHQMPYMIPECDI
jgi:hypothetical protein